MIADSNTRALGLFPSARRGDLRLPLLVSARHFRLCLPVRSETLPVPYPTELNTLLPSLRLPSHSSRIEPRLCQARPTHANLFFDSADNPKHVISTGGRGVCQLNSFSLSQSPPLVSPCCRHTASLSSSSQDMYPYHHSDPHPPVIPGSSDATAHNPRELFVRMPKTVWCQISC